MDTDFYSHSGEFCHYSERNATIHWLFSNEKQGQVTREDGPTWHSVKTGTYNGWSRFPCSQLDYFASNGVIFPPIYAVATNYSIYFSVIRFARLFG